MKIENVNVYGLNESIISSRLPKHPELNIEEVNYNVDLLVHEKRASALGSAKSGSGHDCFLKGIIVQADFSFPQYIWQQMKRYHWFDIVSSCSTMHGILDMDIAESTNDLVLPYSIIVLENLIKLYKEDVKYPYDCSEFGLQINNKEDHYQIIISNIPSGLLLKARVTTNYLQLKTIYNQRKSHKLSEYKEFCSWCESLPMFKEIVLKKD